jgi:hypothetical protein
MKGIMKDTIFETGNNAFVFAMFFIEQVYRWAMFFLPLPFSLRWLEGLVRVLCDDGVTPPCSAVVKFTYIRGGWGLGYSCSTLSYTGNRNQEFSS